MSSCTSELHPEASHLVNAFVDLCSGGSPDNKCRGVATAGFPRLYSDTKFDRLLLTGGAGQMKDDAKLVLNPMAKEFVPPQEAEATTSTEQVSHDTKGS
jgi:hypothetical protein